MNQCKAQHKHIRYDNVNDAIHKGRERELRVNGSSANNKICFEVRAPSSTSPPSHRRFSNPLTYAHRTPTQGTSTEDLGQYNREYTTPLSTENNLSLEARHKATNINLTNEG